MSGNIDPLYNTVPLLRLGSPNGNDSYFKPETYRERQNRRVDDVRDVLIGEPQNPNPHPFLIESDDDLGEGAISEIIEGKNLGLVSKIVDFVKNIFTQIKEALGSVYRFSVSLFSKSDADDEDYEVNYISLEERERQAEISALLDDSFEI